MGSSKVIWETSVKVTANAFVTSAKLCGASKAEQCDVTPRSTSRTAPHHAAMESGDGHLGGEHELKESSTRIKVNQVTEPTSLFIHNSLLNIVIMKQRELVMSSCA